MQVFYFSKLLALIVMQYVPPPHLILRKALIRGDRLSSLAADLSEFMARNLFFTSSLHLTGPEKRAKVAFWSGNHGLCALTEAVVFTEPYCPEVAHNRWTSPQLDATVVALRTDGTCVPPFLNVSLGLNTRTDQASIHAQIKHPSINSPTHLLTPVPLKLAVGKFKAKFMDATEALCHGDLHTGSVMVTEGSTKVIDPEFAFYGPMGFEVGALLANFWLNFFSQAGHGGLEKGYDAWVLAQTVTIWTSFVEKFVALWSDATTHKGELFKRAAYSGVDELAATQEQFVRELLIDSLGFAGCKMIRRIIGIAHVEDFESIEDAEVRAKCESRALGMARELVVNGAKYADMEAVVALARQQQ